MSKLSELVGLLAPVIEQLSAVGAQIDKAQNEIIKSLSDVEIPAEALLKIQELSTISGALKAASQKLDDITPDEPEEPPA